MSLFKSKLKGKGLKDLFRRKVKDIEKEDLKGVQLALQQDNLYEYKRMLEIMFSRFGPSKSIISLASIKQLATPVVAGINPETWDVDITMRRGLEFEKDIELIKFAEKHNMLDAMKEMLRAVGFHEMGHWEFPKGEGFGCPSDKATYYTSFIEPIHEVLKGKLSAGMAKEMAERVANASTDIIVNFHTSRTLEQMKLSFKGQMLFWYLQGQENGTYSDEYTMFVKLNQELFGDEESKKLLEKFMSKNKEIDKAVERLKKAFTESAIYNKDSWDALARAYAREVAAFIKEDEQPHHQYSASDDTSTPSPQNGKSGKEKSKGKGGDSKEKDKKEDEKDKDGKGKGDKEKEDKDKKDGKGGEGKEDEKDKKEDKDKDGKGKGKDEKDKDKDKKDGKGQGKDEKEDGDGKDDKKDDDKDGKGKDGKEEKDEKDKGKKEDDGEQEWIFPDKKDKGKLGDDLTPGDIEKIMGGRRAGKGVPFFIKTEKALDGYYKALARKILFKTSGNLPKADFPLIALTREAFDPEEHDISDADFDALLVDPVAREVLPSVIKRRVPLDIPVMKEKRGLPEFMFALIDSSGSMMGSGDTTIVPWGDKSYYHFALITYYGMLMFFEQERILHKIKVGAAIFNDETLDAQGLEEVKKLLFNPSSGGTSLDIKKVVKNLKGKKDAMFGMISDGEIQNWSSLKGEFIEIAKEQKFFFIQIGNQSQAFKDMKAAGLVVKQVSSYNEIVQLAIDLTVERYEDAISDKLSDEARKYENARG